MENENVVNMQTGILFSHKEKQNYEICRKISGTGNIISHGITGSERQTSHIPSRKQSSASKYEMCGLWGSECGYKQETRKGLRHRGSGSRECR